MPWNPEIYNQFKSYRYKPFFDLMDLITEDNMQHGVDIGCGTGEQTAILANKFQNTSFLGIDSSAEMLAGSNQFVTDRLQFRNMSIQQFVESTSVWDLIFSNAALQWTDDHNQLFPSLISKLNKDGQFAVQMPWQKENKLNMLLLELVGERPYFDMLQGFRRESPLLQIDDYAKLMFDSGLRDIQINLKVYPMIAKNEIELFQFISGSALIPYMERLDPKEQELFTTEFMKRISKEFQPFSAIYPFKRILLYGRA